MNDYTIDTISVGVEDSFDVLITEEMQNQFYGITGDCNPLHMSDCSALAAGFGGRVVYGMLTASFYSTLAGVYIPGKNCLLQECNTSFLRPVKIGDRLTVKGVVAEVDARFERIKVKASIANQNGEKVSRATYYAGFISYGEGAS